MRFWRLNHNNTLLVLTSFCVCLFAVTSRPVPASAEDKFTATGNFPNFTMANHIILKPRTTNPGRCTDGVIFVDNSGRLIPCRGGGQTSLIWQKSGTSIFPTDSNPQNLQFIIGGSVPPLPPGASDHVTLIGLNPMGVANMILIQTSNDLGNSGFHLQTKGVVAVGQNNRAFIDFLIGPAPSNTGRIGYVNLFGGIKGFELSPNVSFPSNNVWINAANHRIGIGTNTPQQQLDIVGGSIETHQLFLRSNGVNEGVLKVGYDTLGGTGYYAVYAP
jgi:hypothetical protein